MFPNPLQADSSTPSPIGKSQVFDFASLKGHARALAGAATGHRNRHCQKHWPTSIGTSIRRSVFAPTVRIGPEMA